MNGCREKKLKVLPFGREVGHIVPHVKAEFIASFLLLLVLVGTLAPLACADSGGNQVSIDSVTVSADKANLIVVVSASIHDPTVQSVLFDLAVSFGDHHMNINKQGNLFATTNSTGAVIGEFATVTFIVPYLGAGYYLIVANCYNAATGALLGSVWVDPREGTAG
jgi:hypothetical protein